MAKKTTRTKVTLAVSMEKPEVWNLLQLTEAIRHLLKQASWPEGTNPDEITVRVAHTVQETVYDDGI